MYLYSLGEMGLGGGVILSFMHLHMVQAQSEEEEDREGIGRERNLKDTKERVEIKSGGERAIKGGGAREAKRESRKAQDDCYSSINDGT